MMENISFTAAVITVSDRCFGGERQDLGGPRIAEFLTGHGYNVIHTAIVPDDVEQIGQALLTAVNKHDAALIITTGGTGFAPRDVTPEATINICEKLAPGIPEAMRAASIKITPRGMLSRGVAGIHSRSLIINLPGSPKAVRECLEVILPALGHGVDILRGEAAECART